MTDLRSLEQSLGAPRSGMTRRQAHTVEYAIIGLCVLALALIFQPFWLWGYTIGAGLVVLGGLAFNLVPHCRPGTPFRRLVRIGLTVLAILLAVILLAIGATELYALYLANR